MPIEYQISQYAAEALKDGLKHLEKYKNLSGVKSYYEHIYYTLSYYCHSTQQPPPPPPLPPIAEIPTDELLKEIKRRIDSFPPSAPSA